MSQPKKKKGETAAMPSLSFVWFYVLPLVGLLSLVTGAMALGYLLVAYLKHEHTARRRLPPPSPDEYDAHSAPYTTGHRGLSIEEYVTVAFSQQFRSAPPPFDYDAFGRDILEEVERLYAHFPERTD